MNNPLEKLNVTTEGGGARATSIYTERKIKIFAVSESELETMSYFNTASIACFSVGSFILSTFFNDIKHSNSDDSYWIFNPIGWVAFLLFIFGALVLLKKTSTLKKSKNNL